MSSLSLAIPATAQTDIPTSAFTRERDGTLAHSGSILQFPEAVAGFRRTGNAVFDPGGAYVGVRYLMPLGQDAQIQLTIAIVQIGQMTPKTHYSIMKPMAFRGLYKVQVIAERPYTRAGGAPGHRGIFKAVRNGRPKMVDLRAFEQGSWHLRSRGEFPATHRIQAEKAIDDLVSQLSAINRSDQTAPTR
ncbi:hypothetical protein OKW76_12470 [Sphingomonas sp. S1-29]|uniref:hypothetical protein n=1 Tax=Sphingomonas sp. S1-29 TaxID=2991074 RepID=UPI0022405E73|nr:hypothetical protein [Sphingomonas sp. S1-29]UZK68844.1 hypothetical protein OKW76_12470 [Sphingomonas sp. S1-29]